MSELGDTLRELDERLVLSRYDAHQWRSVSMAEYALVREYIRKLENQIDVEVMGQLSLREKNTREMLDCVEQIFQCSQKILSSLKIDLADVEKQRSAIQISQEGF